MRGVGRRSQVLLGGGEQVIQHQLVAAPQSAPEASQRLLLVEKLLGDRG